ncbi:hypothetical protein GWK47_014420 [Chionoecetes opilio]|uniref:Uncharacterized protein n=1 Tax=Chionoecetes opilio TaxID=41210 RepID=A0A8J4XUX0_CHIOP|nr:hypothetical protein GWK47_014420 [Chionoecetes opilio]
MDYAPHVVFLPPPLNLSLLDKVQARAQRLIRLKALQDQLLHPLQPLQQRRDVSRSVGSFTRHKQHVPHLAALRQPWARPPATPHERLLPGTIKMIVPFAGRRPLCVPSFHATQECGTAWYSRPQLHSPRHSRPSRTDFDLATRISPDSVKRAVGTGESSYDRTSLISISLELACSPITRE